MAGYDGNGNFDLYENWPGKAGDVISSADAQIQMNAFKTGFQNVLTRDGQNAPSTNLPMGGFRHTNVADAIVDTNYLSLKQFRNNGTIYATTTGSSNAYILALTPAISAYAAGQEFIIKTNFTTTNATPTININGLGVKNLKNPQGNNLIAGQLQNNTIYHIFYDGTDFRILNPTVYFSGNFTPTLYGATEAGVTTYTVQSGYYTVTHNLFKAIFRLAWSNITGTGEARIGGFAFTPAAVFPVARANFSSSYYNSLSLSPGKIFGGFIQEGQNYIRLLEADNITKDNLLDMSGNISSSGEIYGEIEFYI